MQDPMTDMPIPEFLTGGGEMGILIRATDWSKTSLGPVSEWPNSLRTCIRIMLTSRQPIWIGWGHDLIKFYNDPYKTIVGGKHPWALGKPASEVWKDIWKDIEPLLKQVMEKDEGTYVESQLLIMERNGYPEETYYTFSYTPIPGDNGGTAGMICANTDDTERIISERQLKTLTLLGARLKIAISNADIITHTVSTLSENQHDFPFVLFFSIIGNEAVFSDSSLLDSGKLIHPTRFDLDSENPLAILFREAVNGKKVGLFSDVNARLGPMPFGAWQESSDKAILLPLMMAGSGESFGFLVIGSNPYRLLNEKYLSFFALLGDQIVTSFSSINLLEEERKRAEALAEIDRAKTTFFSNISHEFRTPLTLLLGPIEEALNNPETSANNKEGLAVAYRNAIRMQKLVNTLLEFSRIEAGRLDGKFSRVDIVELTRDLVSTFRSAIERSGMTLEITAGEIDSPVYVDTDMWEKIILNLVSNAFKYSSEGKISVYICEFKDLLRVDVTDTGTGIPEDKIDKIFDRFYRVENIAGRSQEGTGIGLALVKELIKIHQGTISVHSKVGVGSRFRIEIPLGKNHLPPEKILGYTTETSDTNYSSAILEEAKGWLIDLNEDQDVENLQGLKESQDNLNTDKPKIVLVDDNFDMRNFLKKILSVYFSVITATDGEEAFEKTLQFRPELVVTDIMMPRMDGFGFLKKLRSYPDIRNIPVIFLSARAGEESKVEGLHAGADDYMTKPFSARELIVRISNLIRINRVRRETEQQFFLLFQQAPALINVMKGPEHIFEFYHPRNKEFLGYPDFTGKTIREAFPSLEGQGIFEMLDDVYQNGVTIQHNERFISFVDEKGNKTDKYLNITYQPWYDIRGEIQGILNFALDVTDSVLIRNKTEEDAKKYAFRLENEVEKRTQELQDLNLSLKKSNDDLQQFAHVASHDLKEPVRKIKMYGNRILEEYESNLPERGREFLFKVLKASNRIMSMIDGVLNYSSFNNTAQKIESIDLNYIIRDIQSDLEVLILEKRARFNIDRLGSVEGSSVLIYQLFYNLVNNALKFSKNGEPAMISISSVKENVQGIDMEKITVEDEGIGFDPVYAQKIFQSFIRLNSRDVYEGTGLGLSLCQKIVERHGGHITAEGTINNGAIFQVWLPVFQIVNQI